jgi:5'-nucleotidase
MPSILVTNDDGIHAPGLNVLVEALQPLGTVTAVAPLREMSACSRSISLFRPVRYEQVRPGRYGVDGTPVDAVIMALDHLLRDAPPDLVVSGINLGANVGLNIFYSGTVGAALEGTLHGITSLAVSVCSKKEVPFGPAAEFTKALAGWLLDQGLSAGMTLNVNVPPDWKSGVRLTRLAPRAARRMQVEPLHGGEPNTFSIREVIDSAQLAADSDYTAVRQKHVSITPIVREPFDPPLSGQLEQVLTRLEEWLRAGACGSGLAPVDKHSR